jgi:uncharacterized membrane protein YfcA
VIWGSAACILLAGWLIGATGIGGVLVVPVLNQLQGIALRDAIAASSLAFALPGLAAAWRLRQAPATAPRGTAAMAFASLPGAAAGALLVHHIAVTWLLAGLAALALASGLWGLRGAPHEQGARPPLSTAAMAVIGAAVGLGSALTGTGGPVLLLPLLLLAGQPLRSILPPAQAIQLPIALCAAAGHALAGALDLRLALVVGGVLLLGSLAGQWAAPRTPAVALHRLVCVLLVLTGAWYAWRLLA